MDYVVVVLKDNYLNVCVPICCAFFAKLHELTQMPYIANSTLAYLAKLKSHPQSEFFVLCGLRIKGDGAKRGDDVL